MEYKDYYQVLGINRSASEKDIKHAYRKLAREFHPDKNPDNKAAEERFKEINEAYEVLGNPDNRAKYDQLGRSYQNYQRMGGAPNGFDFSQWAAAGGPGSGYQQVNIDFDDLFGGSGGFSEFFRTIFGGGGRSQRSSMGEIFGQSKATQGYGAQHPTRKDIEYTVQITLEEAFYGTTRTLSFGSDRFTARIPAGANNGTKVRLKGKGQPGPAGPGDLYLLIEVQDNSMFTREGNNLKVTVPLDVVTAVLGGRVTVPTMTGDVRLKIPAGTQGGQTFRLKGKGMPKLRKKGQYGDLHVMTRIQIPESLTGEEEQLYRQLANLSKATSA